MSEVYLDNSATTQVCPQAAEKVMELLTENYGNPSSLHARGFRAERELTAAREEIAALLGASAEELYFTSGGTESNNLALFGAAYARRKRGNHIVTTMLEHHSVLNVMKQLEAEGFSVTYLKPSATGEIKPEQVFAAVTPETILVSMMHVNNEVGSIMPLEAVSAAITAVKAPALFHVDAVQSFGKLPIKPSKLKIDLMSVSAHKIHGPKGVGALYLKKGVRINPRSFGGSQEKNIRPGTEAVPLIAGFGAAVKALPQMNRELERITALNGYCRERLKEIDRVVINSAENAFPYILNLSCGSVRAETMLHYLSDKEIYVSSGSACAKGQASHVLTAMELPQNRISSSLRLSFSHLNTEREIDRFVSALRDGMNELVQRP